MKITKIKKLKSGKYKIELDNNDSITLYDEVILNNNLLYNSEITDLGKLNQDNEYYNEYYKTLKYAMYKMRSLKEINNYMQKRNIDEKTKKRILEKLKENNIINDNSYIEAFVSDKIYLTNDGPYKIKNDLLKQDIDENLIDKELSKYSDAIFEDKLIKSIDKKVKMNSKNSLYQLKQKLFYHFINMGYSKEMINSILDNVKIDNSNIVQKEYNNLYKKLSKKYQDNELDYQIKNRLYQKGFTSDDLKQIEKDTL